MRAYVRDLVDRVALRFAQVAAENFSSRNQYLGIALLARRYGYTGLAAAELKVFSQNGEDGILATIFSRIGTTNRFFVEFGASDGVECNTRFLMEVLGWSGLYIEPGAAAYKRLEARLAHRDDVRTVHSLVTPDNVCRLFTANGVPAEPDLVSIDIDGQDYWVWEALDAFRPRVVVIEHNATLVGARLVEPKSSGTTVDIDVDALPYQGLAGASMEAMRALGERKGYRLVYGELAGANLFFVRDEYAACFDDEFLPRGANFDLVGRRHALGSADYVEV
jgi:hypothetical protein